MYIRCKSNYLGLDHIFVTELHLKCLALYSICRLNLNFELQTFVLFIYIQVLEKLVNVMSSEASLNL